MKLRVRLAVLFYEVVILLFVCFVILFVLHLVPIDLFLQGVDIVYYEIKFRLLFGLIALLLLLKTHMMANTIYGTHHKEHNIVFENPAGRVYLTLSALEELIRRTLSHVDEVKDAKTSVRAKKNGDLDVATRLVLNGDYNIPEMTSEIQKIIQKKVEKTIGADHKVSVEVDVVKILTRDKGKTKVSKSMEKSNDEDSNVPFEGYRA